MMTAENVTMRDIATLREWAKEGPRRTSYAALARRAEGNGTGSWNALKRIADLINQKKGPWTEES